MAQLRKKEPACDQKMNTQDVANLFWATLTFNGLDKESEGADDGEIEEGDLGVEVGAGDVAAFAGDAPEIAEVQVPGDLLHPLEVRSGRLPVQRCPSGGVCLLKRLHEVPPKPGPDPATQ